MTIKVTENKAQKIKLQVEDLLAKERVTILQLSKLIGSMVASFPGVQYGKRFYRNCDNLKGNMLKSKGGNFSALITLSELCIKDLRWWSDNILSEKGFIQKGKIGFEIRCDASSIGSGGYKIGDKEETTGEIGAKWNQNST